MNSRVWLLMLILAVPAANAAEQPVMDDSPVAGNTQPGQQPAGETNEDVFIEEDVFISDAPLPAPATTAQPISGEASRTNRFRRFRPSDAISADNAVPFPVDI